jgi:Excalibur calcium-binding domain
MAEAPHHSARRALSAVVVAAVAAAGLTVTASPASAAVPAKYKNCTALQKYYPHGVGRSTARDKTSGKPVTTFKRSTKLYTAAIKANKGLDRDKDGIACEKR